MIGKKLFLSIVFSLIILFPTYALSAEVSGWVKSETCWVVKKPSKDAKIVGIIKQKAAVTVEDFGNGWAKTIFAPVRNLIDGRDGMKEGQLYNCAGCYIQMKDISTFPPGRW